MRVETSKSAGLRVLGGFFVRVLRVLRVPAGQPCCGLTTDQHSEPDPPSEQKPVEQVGSLAYSSQRARLDSVFWQNVVHSLLGSYSI